MYLYHYTYEIEEILEEGMRFGSEIEESYYGYNTGPINGVLNDYKTKNLPDFVHRDRCLFFHDAPQEISIIKDAVKVNIRDLHQEKLYVADMEYAQQIWEATIGSSTPNREPLIPLEESAKNYWDSLVPFSVYQQEPTKFKTPEVLYFDRVPKEHVIYSTDLDPFSQQVFSEIKRNYQVKRESLNKGKIFTSPTQFFTIEISPDKKETKFISKTGSIPEKCLDFFEENILHKEKQIIKDGSKIQVAYIC